MTSFIILTGDFGDDDDQAVLINAEHIVRVSLTQDGDTVVVLTHNETMFVREQPREIMAALIYAGCKMGGIWPEAKRSEPA